MFWPRRNKEADRYYLLPGMARSNRRRHHQFLIAAVIIGLFVSGAFGYLLILISKYR